VSKLKSCESAPVLGIFLGVTGLLSALVLALVSQVTAKPIEAAKLANRNRDLKQVLPAFDNLPSKESICVASPAGWPFTFYVARRGGKVVGVAAAGTNPGAYAGNLSALAGISPEGKVLAFLVTEQHETPGLGAEVCARKFPRTIFNLTKPAPAGLPPNGVLDQFSGMDCSDSFDLKQDGGTIDGRTGATVTSRAVTRLMGEMAAAFSAHRDEILNCGEGK